MNVNIARYPNGRKRHVRRCAAEIEKGFDCPYQYCGKQYGCEGSLNLHLKGKHNGGTKTARDKYARELVLSIERGLPEPKPTF